jgi:hypothetical protein
MFKDYWKVLGAIWLVIFLSDFGTAIGVLIVLVPILAIWAFWALLKFVWRTLL